MARNISWNEMSISAVIVVAVAIGAIAVAQVAVMRQKNTDVFFVLPDGYSGLFAVVGDPSIPSDSKCPTFRIPEQGILFSGDADALSRYHVAHAQYSDGSKLNVEGFDSEGEVMLRYSLGALGRNNRDVHFFFVGTRQDADQLERTLDFPERFRKLLK